MNGHRREHARDRGDHRAPQRATRVKVVRLEIGALARVAPDALRFCFDAVTRGGIADGAQLAIVATPGAAWCMPCAETVPLERLGDACPRCGSYQLSVAQGDEMRVKEIENRVIAGARCRQRRQARAPDPANNEGATPCAPLAVAA